MESITKIRDILTNDKYLLFYKIMGYPIPKDNELFFFEKKSNNISQSDQNKFSREKKNQYLDEYIEHINKFGNLFKSIPFVKEIYLCNSISFNALKKNSDIDLFIVTKSKSIRRARFFSLLYFWLSGLKRGKNIRKKFCLSFYVTENNKNLYSLNLSRSDIYLNYWLAHLIILYQEEKNDSSIYENNKWFTVTMPNHPKKISINIGNKKFYGKTKSKSILEFVFGGIIGFITENLIKLLRIPILIRKIKVLGKAGSGILINDNILKFHLDKRKKIHLMYEIERKRYR